MKTQSLCPAATAFLVVLYLSFSMYAQERNTPMGASAARHCAIQGPVNEDIGAQLAKFKQVRMPFTVTGLKPQEIKMVLKLVDASRALENIYWRQSDPKGLEMVRWLATCNQAKGLQIRRFLMINGSRYDLLENNKPFIGSDAYFPGRGLYPAGITREQIDDYVAKHPEKKAEIYNPWTVVRRQGDDLIGVPYHVEYKVWLDSAAASLRAAAALSPEPAFANFLRLRADALLTDDYYKSDLAWMDLEDPKFDVIFAPYETYLDDLLGVKTSYGAAVMIRNEEESQKLALFHKYVASIQA